MPLLNIEAVPFLYSCLSGVFLVFLCFGMLLSGAGLQNAACSQSNTVSSKQNKSGLVIFHQLMALWMLNPIFFLGV